MKSEQYKEIQINYINGKKPDWHDDCRRPFYKIRGTKITEEQAMEIISKTDTAFLYDIDETSYSDRVCGYLFDNIWFNHGTWETSGGWCYPTGEIYEDGISLIKYPSVETFIGEMITFAENFAFLDMVIAVTNWNEIPDEEWDDIDLYDEEGNWVDPYSKYKEHIQFLLHLHNQMIDIYSKEDAVEKYEEYLSDLKITDSGFLDCKPVKNNNKLPNRVEYFKECVRKHGLDVEKIYNRLVGRSIFVDGEQ